ncbi:DinB family protein [Thermodesulfobacteriota bacterium]
MSTEIQHYINTLNELRDQVKQQIDGLSQEELDWRPIDAEGELSTNSLAVAAVHIAGSEPFWMKEIIDGRNINRDRAAEFTTKGIELSELHKRLDAAGQITSEVLPFLSAAQLDEERKWRDQTVSVRWCILHVIDHTAQHLGHMQLTRQLLKVR